MQPPQIVAATFRCISPTDKFYSPIPAASSIRSSSFAATLSGWPLRLTMQTARGGDDPRRGMVADAQIHARMAHGTLAETGNATRNSYSTSGSRRSPISCSVWRWRNCSPARPSARPASGSRGPSDGPSPWRCPSCSTPPSTGSASTPHKLSYGRSCVCMGGLYSINMIYPYKILHIIHKIGICFLFAL